MVSTHGRWERYLLAAYYPLDKIYMCFVWSIDVVETSKEGKVCSIITLEGGHNIGNSLAVLRMYFDLGVRSLALTNKDCSTPWYVFADTMHDIICAK